MNLDRTKAVLMRQTRCPIERRMIVGMHRRATLGCIPLPDSQPWYLYDLGLKPVLPGGYADDRGERPAVIRRS